MGQRVRPPKILQKAFEIPSCVQLMVWNHEKEDACAKEQDGGDGKFEKQSEQQPAKSRQRYWGEGSLRSYRIHPRSKRSGQGAEFRHREYPWQ